MSGAALTVEQVSPAWLSQKLSRCGALVRVEVTAIDLIASTKTRVAEICRLRVRYSPGAAKAGPESLVFKAPRPEYLPMTRREVDVYSQVAPAMPEAPLVRCYDGEYDAALGTYHVLLEDLSTTHTVALSGLPPTRREAEQIVDSLAAFHAFWWDHPRLGVTVGRVPTEYDVRRTIGHAQCYFPRFVDCLGDRLPEQGKRAFERCFQDHAGCLAKRLVQGNVTLVHGDAHASNFLLPLNSDSGKTYILDWNSAPWTWECSLGVSDVAYLMVRYWPAERRRWLERGLLERYHQALLAGGVVGYSWDQLWDDYRQSCLLNLYVVIEEAVGPHAKWWYPQLMNVLAVIEEHDRLEVLRSQNRRHLARSGVVAGQAGV